MKYLIGRVTVAINTAIFTLETVLLQNETNKMSVKMGQR